MTIRTQFMRPFARIESGKITPRAVVQYGRNFDDEHILFVDLYFVRLCMYFGGRVKI